MRLGCILAGLVGTSLGAEEGALRLNANDEGNRKLRNSQYGRLEVKIPDFRRHNFKKYFDF